MTERPAAVEHPIGPTPSQTVGPYLGIGLPWPDGPDIADPPDKSELIVIRGRLTDGADDPVPDGLIEIWQADPDGRFDHPDDPRGAVSYPHFRGFGRCATDAEGLFQFRTLKPGSLPAEAGQLEAPHLDLSVFARGLVDRLITRLYFPDEDGANTNDPVLSTLPAAERTQLVARPDPDDHALRFDICLQGELQTPFFRL